MRLLVVRVSNMTQVVDGVEEEFAFVQFDSDASMTREPVDGSHGFGMYLQAF